MAKNRLNGESGNDALTVTELPNNSIVAGDNKDKVEAALAGIDAESGIALGVQLPVKVMRWLTTGTEKAIDHIDKQIAFGESLLDLRSAQMMVRQTFIRLNDTANEIKKALYDGTDPILLVGAKREVRLCKKQITELFKQIDPDMTQEDLDDLFAEVEEVLSTKPTKSDVSEKLYVRRGSAFVPVDN